MTPALVQFTNQDGSTVLVEVENLSSGPLTRGGRTESAVVEAGTSLDNVLGTLGPTLGSLVARVRGAVDSPDEVEIEFAVKLSTDANVIIARAGGEANFRISMKWSKTGGG